MSLLQDHRASERGNEICRVLKHRGLNPLWFKTEQAGERIILCIQFLPGPPGWAKAFVLTTQDTPDTAHGAIDQWKLDKLRELAIGAPPEVIKDAIAHYGETRVRAALMPSPMVLT